MTTFVFWVGSLYFSFTKQIADYGGKYTEGVIGQPLYVNPLLSQTSEVDADLTKIIYSGIFKYNAEGNIVNDLAEDYEISEDGKTYKIKIKKNILWHDGEGLNASDIFFTISALQNPAYKSPLRYNWTGVKVIQLDDYTLEFQLENPYFAFLNNLTVGILPKHIWENIAPEKFALADYNLKPIGSGPYKFLDYQKDSNGNILSYEMSAFENYFGVQPYLFKLIFNFYPDENATMEAYFQKDIMGMGGISSEKISASNLSRSAKIYEMTVPRYFSVFFNQNKNVALADDEVREALLCAVSRQAILDEVFNGKGVAVNAPFLDSMREYAGDLERCENNPEKARQILEDNSWKVGEDGVREKDGVKLKFEILTTDWPELAQTADIISEQWRQIGALAEVRVLSVSDLQQNYIRPREYDALLYGQAVSFTPDPYSFWHSSQRQDPGLNLSLFNNKDADKLLEESRVEADREKRKENYQKFQEIIIQENPATFLYSPYYLYIIDEKVKGIGVKNANNPSSRFLDINTWYIKTKRVKK